MMLSAERGWETSFAAQSTAAFYTRTGGPVMSEEDPLDPAPRGEVRENLAAIRRQVAAGHHVGTTRPPSQVGRSSSGRRDNGSCSRDLPDADRRVVAGAHPHIVIYQITELGCDFDTPQTFE